MDRNDVVMDRDALIALLARTWNEGRDAAADAAARVHDGYLKVVTHQDPVSCGREQGSWEAVLAIERLEAPGDTAGQAVSL